MRLTRERVKEVRDHEVGHGPAELDLVKTTPARGAGREVTHERAQSPKRQPAPPEVREVDTIEALKIGFYRVGSLTKKRDERRQFPKPSAF
jgi:hypothetical protein